VLPVSFFVVFLFCFLDKQNKNTTQRDTGNTRNTQDTGGRQTKQKYNKER
jgi:hypothetical protein